MKIRVADDRPAFVPVLIAGLVAGLGTLVAQSGLIAAGMGPGGLTSLLAIGTGLFVGLVARGPIEGALGHGDEAGGDEGEEVEEADGADETDAPVSDPE